MAYSVRRLMKKVIGLVLVLSLITSSLGMTVVAASTSQVDPGSLSVSRTVDKDTLIYNPANDGSNNVVITYTITPNMIAKTDTTLSQVELTNVRFEEILPEDIRIVSLDSGVDHSGQLIFKDLEDIEYRLNGSGNYYVAETVSFSITVAPESAGQMTFGEEESAAIHFLDMNNAMQHVYFDELILAVNTELPTGSNELKVLEIQPFRDFELNATKIANAFPAYATSLAQISLPEFIGKVDEINGQYDLIYMGSTIDFEDFKFVGSDHENSDMVKMDIDITNRRAKRLLEFINSGQCFTFDNSILNYSGSKLEANIEPIKNEANVYRFNNLNNNTFYNKVEGWYETSNKRPSLTVVEEPKTYDGSDSSYLDSHTMSFRYNAFNENDGPMTANLYLDIDGNGIFETEELAVSKSVIKNIAGLGINYHLDDSFNGGIAWKLELLVDATNAKNYQEGFVAFKGTETSLRVLNLVPDNASLILDKYGVDLDRQRAGYSNYLVKDNPSLNRSNDNTLQADLYSTEDGYAIQVDRMLVTNFNNSYSGANPVQLDGVYDMILFGFGDSYRNKDVTNTLALSAIDDFIKTGQSVMFTHDLAGPEDYVNNFDMYTSSKSYNKFLDSYNDAVTITENFKDDMGFSNNRTYAGQKDWKAWTMTKAYMQNAGLITMYPYQLPVNIPIATTHDQYWKIDLENENVVPWYNLDNTYSNGGGTTGNIKYYPEAYYYTFSNANVTYSGTGHSTAKGIDEQRLFVNTMFKASRGSNHAPTVTLAGAYDGMNIPPSTTTIDFKLQIDDIDITDKDFTTKIYLTYGGTRKLVETRTDLVKGVLTPISIPKGFDASVTDFKLEVVVEDSRGATGNADNDYIQKDIPLLLVDGFTGGCLKGDVITGEISINSTLADHKDKIYNIDLTTTFDNAYFDVTSSVGMSVVGNEYSLQPSFDSPDTSGVDETDLERTVTFKALQVGSPGIPIKGTYDIKYNLSDTTFEPQNYRADNDYEIKSGRITVDVTDDLSRGVGNVDVTINGASGSEVVITTGSTGYVEISDMISDTYTVTIDAPSNYGYSGIARTFSLNYATSMMELDYTLIDNTPPEVTYTYDRTIKDASAGAIILPIHVKLDGVNSKIVDYDVKEVPSDFTKNDVARFMSLPSDPDGSGPKTALDFPEESDADSPLNLDPTLDPVVNLDYERLHKFNVSQNGYYAVYLKNEAGMEVVEVIQIVNILDGIFELL